MKAKFSFFIVLILLVAIFGTFKFVDAQQAAIENFSNHFSKKVVNVNGGDLAFINIPKSSTPVKVEMYVENPDGTTNALTSFVVVKTTNGNGLMTVPSTYLSASSDSCTDSSGEYSFTYALSSNGPAGPCFDEAGNSSNVLVGLTSSSSAFENPNKIVIGAPGDDNGEEEPTLRFKINMWY